MFLHKQQVNDPLPLQTREEQRTIVLKLGGKCVEVPGSQRDADSGLFSTDIQPKLISLKNGDTSGIPSLKAKGCRVYDSSHAKLRTVSLKADPSRFLGGDDFDDVA